MSNEEEPPPLELKIARLSPQARRMLMEKADRDLRLQLDELEKTHLDPYWRRSG